MYLKTSKQIKKLESSNWVWNETLKPPFQNLQQPKISEERPLVEVVARISFSSSFLNQWECP